MQQLIQSKLYYYDDNINFNVIYQHNVPAFLRERKELFQDIEQLIKSIINRKVRFYFLLFRPKCGTNNE